MNSAVRPFVFVIDRVVDAPLEKVWRAVTDKDLLPKWFGPKGSETLQSSMDLQVGGRYQYELREPDGTVHWGIMVFREIEPMGRLVSVMSHADADGNIVPSPFGTPWPLEILSTMEFAEVEGKTKITISWQALDHEEAFVEGAPLCRIGWTGALDTLADFVAEDLAEVRVSREFSAPAEKVFDAWLDPALAARFLYRTEGGVIETVEIDAQEGGRWRVTERRGEELADHFGVYVIVDRPYRLTFTFGTAPGENALVDISFEATDTGCRLELVQTFDQAWAPYRDSIAKGWSGILEGLADSLA